MSAAARLILDDAASGGWNMAVDETLLASAAAAGATSIRLYAWRGAWLSLGYAQELEPGRLRACRMAGVGVVRRITGGGAVLHGADLTYAVAAPAGRLPPGLQASCELLGEALVEALSRVGIQAQRQGRAPRGRERTFDCFADVGAEEICVGGRKLVGSAQRRSDGAILQHGSIRLAPDPPASSRAAGTGSSRATSLAEVGWCGDRRALRRAVAECLARALGLPLAPCRLEPAERETAGRWALRPPRERRKSLRRAELAASRAPCFRR